MRSNWAVAPVKNIKVPCERPRHKLRSLVEPTSGKTEAFIWDSQSNTTTVYSRFAGKAYAPSLGRKETIQPGRCP